MKISTAILLINVGTPDSPRVGDVRRYLSEFLNDGRVIDMPTIPRFLLVNGIIVPFRAPRSAGLYQKLWTDEGSPLLVYGNRLKERLQSALGSGFDTFLAMRYGNPRLKSVLEEIRNAGYDRLVVVPLFPQFASSTTGTAIQKVMGIISEWNVIPEVKIVGQFWNDPRFIDAFVENINLFDPGDYDHILFSYHGLPLSHVNSIHPQVKAETCNCTEMMPAHGKFCYRATCYGTTRLLAEKLSLETSRYSVAFQSRLTQKWLTPFSDRVLMELAEKGMRKVLVAAPSFVTDCLETTYEIGVEYNEIFRKHGGEQLDLVPSLNDSPLWIDVLKSMVMED